MAKAPITAIIVAAGSSRRFKPGDKMFVEIAGHPVLYYSLNTIETSPEIHDIVVTVQKKNIKAAQELIRNSRFKKVRAVVAGGNWRGGSVLKALAQVDERCEWVLVHDGARPALSPGAIKKLVSARGRNDSLSLAVPVTDTVMKVDINLVADKVLDRSALWNIQTPQLSRKKMLNNYLKRAQKTGLRSTDDCGLFLKYGGKVKIVEGDRKNVKITYRGDLTIVEGILKG